MCHSYRLLWDKKNPFLNISKDANGKTLFLEADIDGDIYVLVNFYNNNIKSDQIHILLKLNNLLNKIADSSRTKNNFDM